VSIGRILAFRYYIPPRPATSWWLSFRKPFELKDSHQVTFQYSAPRHDGEQKKETWLLTTPLSMGNGRQIGRLS